MSEVTRIIAAVEPSICRTWGSKGETVEGRILKDDFWILVNLARKGEGWKPAPPAVVEAVKVEALAARMFVDWYGGTWKTASPESRQRFMQHALIALSEMGK